MNHKVKLNDLAKEPYSFQLCGEFWCGSREIRVLCDLQENKMIYQVIDNKAVQHEVSTLAAAVFHYNNLLPR